jgi:hypothetical protein
MLLISTSHVSLIILLRLSLLLHRLPILAALWWLLSPLLWLLSPLLWLLSPLLWLLSPLLWLLMPVLLIWLWLHVLLLWLSEGSIPHPTSAGQRRVLEFVFLLNSGRVEAGRRSVAGQVNAEDGECYGEEDPVRFAWLA